MAKESQRIDLGEVFEKIRTELQQKGVDIDFAEALDRCCGGGKEARVKVVCLSPDLRERVQEMGQATRDQVVMVRVDESTLRDLDAWVATGAVKSRSEAAALFVREGLRLRAGELDQLSDALKEVEEAQRRLKNRAQEIFGESD